MSYEGKSPTRIKLHLAMKYMEILNREINEDYRRLGENRIEQDHLKVIINNLFKELEEEVR